MTDDLIRQLMTVPPDSKTDDPIVKAQKIILRGVIAEILEERREEIITRASEKIKTLTTELKESQN